MAEFKEVILKKKAMCDYYYEEGKSCKLCPLYNKGCNFYAEPVKLEEIEEIIMNWEKPSKPVDWSKVEVDTKILVRERECDEWRKRYFAKYADGKIYAFCDGATSWSANRTLAWDYAKLWEGEE